MNKFLMTVLAVVMLAMTATGALAAPGSDFTDSCYTSTHTDSGDLSLNLNIVNSCADNSSILWPSVNLTILGNVTDDEMYIGDTWMYVDSAARPDLDAPATLIFKNLAFAVEPNVLVDGTTCSSCNVTHFPNLGRLEVDVPGFSNYTLTAQQDFTVYSNDEPYLENKIYQTVDLGDARRTVEYACIVQVFVKEQNSAWVLAQTNPKRAPQGKLFGDTDPNQPESLGYFPTVNGIVNTYFRDDNLWGYMELQRVIQCTTNGTAKLVHEESIDTRYFPAGRGLTGRLLWLNDEDNAFYTSFMLFGGLIVLWVVAMIYRRSLR
jgi:hypothetical protein